MELILISSSGFAEVAVSLLPGDVHNPPYVKGLNPETSGKKALSRLPPKSY